MSKQSFYLTTPIYYVTDGPHIGNAYTTIAADVLARYKRACNYDVHFLTGSDEHGLKVQRAAEAKGVTPLDLANSVVARFHEAWSSLGISHDDFIRTTEQRHEDVVRHIFQRLHENGDLYLGDYKGWYCVHCESFLKDSDEKQNCPDCGRPGEWNSEPCYFFRLSKYADRLLQMYEQHPEFVRPQSRLNEVRSRVKAGLRDMSVTRTTLDWAAPVGFDPDHRAYVWVDALVNYISAIGFTTDDDNFALRWPADVHLIGKDIIWFHAVIWPAMLMSLGLELPKQVFAHGFWTRNGEKMSKSKGNFVNPSEVIEEYSVDTLRYFLLREVPFGLDGDYRDAALEQRYNSELAGDLGNLVFRTLSMIERYFEGIVPDPTLDPAGPMSEAAASLYKDIDQFMGELQFNRVLERIWEFVRRANRYVEESKPWQLAKEPESKPKLAAVLYHLAEASRILSVLLEPTMPHTSSQIRSQLGLPDEIGMMGDELAWGLLKPGIRVQRGNPLFPKKDR